MTDLRAEIWNRAVEATRHPAVRQPEMPFPAPYGIVRAYNQHIPNDDEGDTGEPEFIVKPFQAVWIYLTYDQLESESIDLRSDLDRIPYRIGRDPVYSTIWNVVSKPFFYQLGIAQERIEPGAVGRIRVEGITLARTYRYIISDHTFHSGQTADSYEDFPWAGVRTDGIMSPYSTSPQMVRLIKRNTSAVITQAEATDLDNQVADAIAKGIEPPIIYDYGIITLPIFPTF